VRSGGTGGQIAYWSKIKEMAEMFIFFEQKFFLFKDYSNIYIIV
jgi:hypothetical protein